MKANKLHIKEIVTKGEASISSTRRILNIVAFLLTLAMLLIKVRITEGLLGVLISSLAIFSGFFFTLIVYITDKSVTKIAQINDDHNNSSPNLAARKFKQSYIDFTKKIIAQISYSILLSVFLIIIAFISQIELFQVSIWNFVLNTTEWISILTTFIFGFLSIRLIYFILVVIGNMQSFFYSEIDQVQDNYK